MFVFGVFHWLFNIYFRCTLYVSLRLYKYVTNLSLVIFVSIYLKLAGYNVTVPKTLVIICWCHSVLVTIYVSYFTSKICFYRLSNVTTEQCSQWVCSFSWGGISLAVARVRVFRRNHGVDGCQYRWSSHLKIMHTTRTIYTIWHAATTPNYYKELISECFKNVTLARNNIAPWRWS